MASPPAAPIFPFSSHTPPSTGPSVPIIAIAIIGILATGFLLVSYYLFVIKCCITSHRHRLRHSSNLNSTIIYPPAPEPSRGLDQALIRSIPIIRFRKEKSKGGGGGGGDQAEAHYECAVCLSEFGDGEKLRVIPNCCHAFHIDCIDVWLQSNANCPLCRASISSNTFVLIDQTVVPPGNGEMISGSSRGDEEFVVIDLRDNDVDETRTAVPVDSVPSKAEQNNDHVISVGDECVEIRRGELCDDGFRIQPMRRSISMDSSRDRGLYMQIQEILQKQKDSGSDQGCSSSNRSVKRLFFSFSSNGR